MTLLTDRECDDLLRYPAGRTRRLAAQGKIPAIVLPDGSLRIEQDELRRILDAGRVDVQTAPTIAEAPTPATVLEVDHGV